MAVSRDRLKQLIEGKAIINVFPLPTGRYAAANPVGYDSFLEELTGKGSPRVKEVNVKGKLMWWRMNFSCEHEDWFLHCTYGMSGSWNPKAGAHSAFGVYYNDSGVSIQHFDALYFNDPRHFGTLKFVGSKEHDRKLRTLGPDILSGQVNPGIFATNVLRKPDRTIAEALMDQSVVSGVGNYIKAEALLRAGVAPHKFVHQLVEREFEDLCDGVLKVAKEAYDAKGASIRTYRTLDGDKGAAQFDFRVYSRRTCPLGHAVSRAKAPDGRTNWWCPVCQP